MYCRRRRRCTKTKEVYQEVKLFRSLINKNYHFVRCVVVDKIVRGISDVHSGPFGLLPSNEINAMNNKHRSDLIGFNPLGRGDHRDGAIDIDIPKT